MTQAMTSRKILRRFYEPLLLLSALGEIRGDRTKPDIEADSVSPNIQRLRRAFVDGIAYICAYEKHPHRVTAAALEQTPQGITVWLAANADIGDNVIHFLKQVLSDIHRISELDERERRQQEGDKTLEDLTSRIVAFNAPRIRVYHEQVADHYAPVCLDTIGKVRVQSGNAASKTQHHLDSLLRWLPETFSNGSSYTLDVHELQAIVRTCYQKRRSPSFEILKSFAGLSETRRSEFEQLFKLLCKLGKHVHITKSLVQAAVSLSQDFAGGFRIEKLPSSKEQKFPLTPKEATVESTIHRMFSTEEEQSSFMARLQSIWDPSELSRKLYTRRKTKTKVHAELLLIDHFERRPRHFLDGNDKYIGCSKPACYLCYAYIASHPGRYAIPPSHQKLYVGWRLPDMILDDANSAMRQKREEQVMLKLIEWVRRDIKTDIESRTSRLPYHADSTAGLTSMSKTEASPQLSAISIEELSLNANDLQNLEINDHGVSQAHSGSLDASDDDDDDDDDDDEGGVRLE